MAIVAAGIITALILLMAYAMPAIVGAAVGQLLYGIAVCLFELCDFVQMIFRKFAGLDVYWFNDGGGATEKSGDILLSLFTSDVVIEALISMTLFAVALLLIVTIVQIIRVEYTTEGSKNSKGTIIGKSLKSLAMFILIPVVCFLGVFVSNKILASVDAATAQSGSSTLSGYIFLAGAADANVIRNGDPAPLVTNWHSETDARVKANLDTEKGNIEGWSGSAYFQSNKADEEGMREDIASKVDQVFVAKYTWFTKEGNTAITVKEAIGNESDLKNLAHLKPDFNLHYTKPLSVQYFYNLMDMNFFILYLGSGFILLAMIKATMGLVMRLYKATALFIISPAVNALTPIDDGNAYKQWKKAFISSVLGAYGFVVAMNLLFLLLGIIDNIYIFQNKGVGVVANALVQAIMVIVGVNMINDLAGQISGFIGGEDILKTGTDMGGKVTKTVGNIGSKVGGAVMMGAGAIGGIASKINSRRAANATATKSSIKAGAKLEELKKVDTSTMTEKELKKHNKEIAKQQKIYDEGSAESRAQKFRQKAAAGARAQMRGRETLKNTWEGSAVGSFLNTATGGYVPLFGGKTVENMDKKLMDGNETIYKIAQQDDARGVKGAINAARSFLPDAFDSKGKFKKVQAIHEQNFAKNQAIQQVAGDYGNVATNGEVKKFNENEKYVKERADNVANTKEILSRLQAQANSTENPDMNLLKNLQEQFMKLDSKGMDNESKAIFNQVKEAMGGLFYGDTAIASLIKDLDIDSLKASTLVHDSKGNTMSYDDYLKTDEGIRSSTAQAARSHEQRVHDNGLKEVDNTMDAFTNYDKYMEKLKEAKEKQQGKGGQGGDPKADSSMTINNAKIEVKDGNVDMKSKSTSIDDGQKLAHEVSRSISTAMKEMQEKNAKEKLENRNYEMLEKIQKLLKNIEKNTKKK